MATKKAQGTVKFFNESKGFGFIIPDDVNEEEIFFHVSGLPRGTQVAQDDAVSYDLAPSKKGKGFQAVNVEKM